MSNSDTALVSACGLYCGNCHKYRKGSCPGCAENDKASWCQIRGCVAQRGLSTCSGCQDFEDVDECRKFNNFVSRLFSFIFRSDRKASLKMIGEVGLPEYARKMAEEKLVVLKRT